MGHMTNGAEGPLDDLAATVRAAAAAIRGEGGGASVQLKVERSKRDEQGDYSTNAAMLLAPVLSAPPAFPRFVAHSSSGSAPRHDRALRRGGGGRGARRRRPVQRPGRVTSAPMTSPPTSTSRWWALLMTVALLAALALIVYVSR